MRLRQAAKTTCCWRAHSVTKDAEGGTTDVWATAVPIEARIWPAGGRVQAEQYGERLTYMKNMLYEGAEALMEGDGFCVSVAGTSDPDYRIVSVQREYFPLVIMLEKVIP